MRQSIISEMKELIKTYNSIGEELYIISENGKRYSLEELLEEYINETQVGLEFYDKMKRNIKTMLLCSTECDWNGNVGNKKK